MPQLCFWGFFIIHFIFTSFTQTSGTLLSIVWPRTAGGFQWLIILLRRSKLLRMAYQPTFTPLLLCLHSSVSCHHLLFNTFYGKIYFSSLFCSFLSILDWSLPSTRIVLDFFLDPYILPSTHYLAFSANIMCRRKPFLSMPVCIRWVLWCFCRYQ